MLLGIAGFKESGKNTAAEMLEGWGAVHKIRARSQGFADDLKVSAARALGFKGTREESIAFANSLKADGVFIEVMKYKRAAEVDPRDEPEITSPIMVKITGREFLQNYGTEAHREVFGDDFWVDNLLPEWQATMDRKWGVEDPHSGILTLPDLMQVTDCRFPNEAQRIKDKGGYILEIEKPDLVVNDDHVSEKPLPRHFIDHVVVNDSTLSAFAIKMHEFGARFVQPAVLTGSWA